MPEPVHLTRVELVEELYRRCDSSPYGPTRRDVSQLLDHLEDVLTEAMASGGRVSLVGFGTFSSRLRKARVPFRRVPTFTPGARLRAAVDGAAPEGAAG